MLVLIPSSKITIWTFIICVTVFMLNGFIFGVALWTYAIIERYFLTAKTKSCNTEENNHKSYNSNHFTPPFITVRTPQ